MGGYRQWTALREYDPNNNVKKKKEKMIDGGSSLIVGNWRYPRVRTQW